MYVAGVEVEVLGIDRGSEGADALERSTPETGNHIHGKRHGDDSEHEACYADFLHLVVVRQADLAEQVHTEQREDHNPEGDEYLTVHQTPAVGEVGNREELQGERELKETEHNLDGVHPAARLGHGLEHCREHREEREGESQSESESGHADSRRDEVACGGRLDEQGTDDRAGAAERDEAERERHEEDGEIAGGGINLGVHLVGPLGGECKLEAAHEREGENHEQNEERDVETGACCKLIESRGTEETGHNQTEGHVDHNDREAVDHGGGDRLAARLVRLQEEADGHRNHRPYAGGHKSDEAADEPGYEDVPQTAALLAGVLLESADLSLAVGPPLVGLDAR